MFVPQRFVAVPAHAYPDSFPEGLLVQVHGLVVESTGTDFL
jgi:hypothetical protein